jgi:hypothetical protein
MAFDETETLSTWLIGEQLQNIALYQVNEHYFVFNPTTIVIDGGIVLDFGNKKLSIGWNAEKELIDSSTDSINSLLGELEYYTLEDDEIAIMTCVTGRNVVNIEIKWSWYNDVNDDFEFIDGDRYIIEEIIIEFEGGVHLQIATIDYTVEDRKIHKPVFSCQGEILVTTNRILDIQNQ